MPICIVDIHVCCRFGNIQNKAIQETSKSIKLERQFTGPNTVLTLSVNSIWGEFLSPHMEFTHHVYIILG
jgi:hypothetical protein